MLKVSLLNYTPNPERTVALAMRQSHAKGSVAEMDLSDEEVERLINLAWKRRHMSVFEHATFSFTIEGISRSCSHQLVRHRFFSFTQQSQRYVELTNGSAFVTPTSITVNAEAEQVYNEALQNIYNAYQKLLDLKIPEEDARFLLPNATETKLVATANARELIHFFSLRSANDAQWEIRQLAEAMLAVVTPLAPHIFRSDYFLNEKDML